MGVRGGTVGIRESFARLTIKGVMNTGKLSLSLFHGRFVDEQLGLPRQKHFANLLGMPRDLCELGTVGDQGWLDLQALCDAIAVGANPVLQLDLVLSE